MTDDTTNTADGGAVELALRLIPPEAWQTVFALVQIAVDPKAVKRHLRSLHDALAATTAAQQKLEAQRIELEAQWARDRAEILADRVKLREGQVELASKKDRREDDLLQREKRIRELEDLWKFVGEEDDVRSGFPGGGIFDANESPKCLRLCERRHRRPR